jgi:glycosyltransferase involved in cell wall biosynthesis
VSALRIACIAPILDTAITLSMALRKNARFCFVSTLGELGGAEVCLLDTIEVLKKLHPEWRAALIVPSDGALALRARELDIQVEIVPCPASLARIGDSQFRPSARSTNSFALATSLISAMPAFASYRSSLRRTLRSFAPDVVYASGFKAQILAAMVRPRSSRLIWHTHDYVSSRPIVARLFRRYARRADRLIANSKSVAEDIHSILGSDSVAPLDVIYNAVDLNRFSPRGERLDLDRLSGLDPTPFGSVRVALVATMAWWKGHRTYLEAMSRLRTLPVRGYLMGGPIYRTGGSQTSLAELRDETQKLGINDRMGFTGFLPDIGSALRSVDIVVHASTRPEPFGRVLIEAMACGKPVITTGLGGSAEIVSAGPGNLKFWPGEADDLAKAISTLVRNPSLRKSMGESARKTAVQHFGREQLAANLDRVLQSLSSGARPAVIEPALPLEEKALASGI